MCWVDLGWLPGTQQATLSIPFLNWAGEKIRRETHGSSHMSHVNPVQSAMPKLREEREGQVKQKKNKKTTPPPQHMHQIWGGQGLFLWPSALPGGRLGAWRGWAAEAPVCQHKFCCVPSVHRTAVFPSASGWDMERRTWVTGETHRKGAVKSSDVTE